MKKFRFFAAVCCVVFALTACGGYASESALLQAGQDLIAVMDEMVHSEDYAAMIGGNGFAAVRDEVMAGDYASPVAVYGISMPPAEDMLAALGGLEQDTWNSLSDTLKGQLENRVSFSNIVSILNAQAGSEKVALASLYIAIEQADSLKAKESSVLLYVFEKGTPIAVIFTEYGGMQGQFLFLEDTAEEAISTVLGNYSCTVRRIK